MEYKNLARTAHAIGQNCFHLIWTPKYRYPIFRFEPVRRQCEVALRDVAARHDITVHELCVEKDHVHMFVELPITMSVSGAFQILKGGSAYLLRKSNPWMQKYKAFWSIGKFHRSVGSVTDNAIRTYIGDSHHFSKIPSTQQRLKA